MFKRSLIFFSVSVHFVMLVAGIYYLEDKITSHWRWPFIERYVFGDIDSSKIFDLGGEGLDSLPNNRWVKIHQQTKGDEVYFSRQAHAGSAFDALRGRLLLFGSDTHEANWDNSLYSFDMSSLRWLSSYDPELFESYSVTEEGVPVSGKEKNRPWAMHTFGALAYDAVFDRLVVASFPGHLSPNKFGKSMALMWREIKDHPTWAYNFSSGIWTHYLGENVDFFPYSIAYDSFRGVVTGFRPSGIFEWEGEKGWRKVGNQAYAQWHTNVVYDSVNRRFILYGGNDMTNNVYTYQVGDEKTRKMPTKGLRPPAGQSVPLVFNSKLARTIALLDVEKGAQTWLYDSVNDIWKREGIADFPYPVGMNYTMEYDKQRDVIVLVSSPPNEETAVWALRLAD